VVSYPRRNEVWLIGLDPDTGDEIKKTRPCLVVFPNEMNEPLHTVLVAPMTTTLRNYPTRVNLTFARTNGQVALDQLRLLTGNVSSGDSGPSHPERPERFPVG